MNNRKKWLAMVTNDDGVQSAGIIALAKAVSRFASVMIIGPEQPQSAAGMSLTFHKPLRVAKVFVENWQCYAVSGSPADSMMIGVNSILPRRPDIVASGINFGDNVTFQDVLASGTVAAAVEAALMGIPAIAFSMVVPEESIFAPVHPQTDFANPAAIAGEIVREVLLEGLPAGVELLNVNFPAIITSKTRVRITTIERRKYRDVVLERMDPRGRPYYWLWGERLPQFEEDSDASAIHGEHAISISPMALNLSTKSKREMEILAKRMEERVEGKIAELLVKHR